MRGLILGFTTAMLLVGLACCAVNGRVSFDNPVANSADDEVKSLPFLNEPISFRHYSGYLNADTTGKKFLHYWFVEATDDPTKKPLLLWLNGGPGCSSMEGLFSELGPFALNGNGSEVSLREYSWNKLANVLFIESPAGVGFSYSKSFISTYTDDSVAKANHLALKSFMSKFPQYQKNPLFLSGESYAGVYLPTLGVLVDDDKDFNLKGIAIGNGYLDAHKLRDSLIFFSYHHGLVGKSYWDKLSKECCNGKPPTRNNCNLDDPQKCPSAIFDEIDGILSSGGLNPYNLYGDCPSTSSSQLSRRAIDLAIRDITNQRLLSNERRPFEVLEVSAKHLRDSPPCFDGQNMVNFLNNDAVRKAIHIPDKVQGWQVCASLNYVMQYPFKEGGLAPQIKKLISSPRKLALLVFNGDTDLMCNALGDEWFVDDLGLKVIKDYEKWVADDQVAGWVQHYDGITYATVRGAGHMVPEYRPKEAFAMIKVLLNSKGHNVFL